MRSVQQLYSIQYLYQHEAMAHENSVFRSRLWEENYDCKRTRQEPPHINAVDNRPNDSNKGLYSFNIYMTRNKIIDSPHKKSFLQANMSAYETSL